MPPRHGVQLLSTREDVIAATLLLNEGSRAALDDRGNGAILRGRSNRRTFVSGLPKGLAAPMSIRLIASVIVSVIAWVCMALVAPALSLAAGAAAPPARSSARVSGWQAVLVAGDKAEPVFDNGVAAMQQILTASGVPAQNIHALSAAPGGRLPGAEPASLAGILQRVASLQPRPGEGCLVYITSHGQRGQGVWLAYAGEFLTPAALARALAAGCGNAPTVVVVSACYSGAFAAPPLAAPNRIVLTAARPDRPSFGCQADRTYTVYDECLLGALQRAARWRAASDLTRACVTSRERELQVVPSQPRTAFGAAVKDLALR